MINWLRTRLHNFIFPQDINAVASPGISIREKDEPDIDGMRFTVMVAEGGNSVQMRHYDRRKDENKYKTYVVPDTESDIAHRIGQIVAMELIRL